VSFVVIVAVESKRTMLLFAKATQIMCQNTFAAQYFGIFEN